MSRYNILHDMPVRVVDPKALTIDEICAKTGLEKHAARRLARQHVADGRWEQVWKRGVRSVVPAYRGAK